MGEKKPQWVKDMAQDRKIDAWIERVRTRHIKPGTIKKAIDFVAKKSDEFTEFDSKTGFWRKPGSQTVNDKAANKTSIAPKIRQAKKMRKVEELINPRRFDKPTSKCE
jgi:hypothetical protein